MYREGWGGGTIYIVVQFCHSSLYHSDLGTFVITDAKKCTNAHAIEQRHIKLTEKLAANKRERERESSRSAHEDARRMRRGLDDGGFYFFIFFIVCIEKLLVIIEKLISHISA